MSSLAVGCALFTLALQGGTATKTLPPELENYGDPPSLFKPMGRRPMLVVPYQGFTSFQVNVDGQQQDIVGDAANEPSICVDPNHPDRIAIGWRQFDNVASNFRQGGYGFSTDGGSTWNFPGVLESGVFRSDPVLFARYDGTFFYLSLLETFYDTLFKSLDQGASWSAVGAAEGGDKQWFTIDNTTSMGRGNLYQIWSTAGNNYGGRQFTRSTDSGLSWMSPINLPQSPIWGTLDVASDGTLYVGGWGNQGFTIDRSSNARNAAVTPSFDLSQVINLGGSIDYGSPINPGGLTGQMWLAVDRSSGSPNPVYALCSVYVNSGNPADVMISRSSDGGSSWTAPLRVNDDPANVGAYHWFGALGVAPSGRLDVAWNDTRDVTDFSRSSLYYAYSLDGGSHFSANIRVSPAFDQSLGYPNQNKMGDYIQIASNSVGANIAYTATFTGGEDVYFLRIPSPIVVPPTDFHVAGVLSYTGGLSDLDNIDGNRLTLLGPVQGSSYPGEDLILDGISPSPAPKALLFNLVAKNSAVGQVANIFFFNWRTGMYERIGAKVLGNADTYLNVLAPGDASRFVQPGTNAMRTLVRITMNGLRSGLAWRAGMDQTVWHVIP